MASPGIRVAEAIARQAQGFGRILREDQARRLEQERYATEQARLGRAEELSRAGFIADLLKGGFRSVPSIMPGTAAPSTAPLAPGAPGASIAAPDLSSGPSLDIAPRVRSLPPQPAGRPGMGAMLMERAAPPAARGRLSVGGQEFELAPEPKGFTYMGREFETPEALRAAKDIIEPREPRQRRTGTVTVGDRVGLYDLDTGELVRDLGSRPPAAASDRPVVVQGAEGGPVVVDPRTATSRPVTSGAGGDRLQLRPPTNIQQGHIHNRRQAGTIQRALEAIERHPEAAGFWRGRVDALDQRIDPEGVDARAAIADVGSLEIRDRSGAAVTAAEFPRLTPFIPSPQDNAATVKRKLRRMMEIIQEENLAMEEAFPALRPNRIGDIGADPFDRARQQRGGFQVPNPEY